MSAIIRRSACVVPILPHVWIIFLLDRCKAIRVALSLAADHLTEKSDTNLNTDSGADNPAKAVVDIAWV